VRFWSLYVGKKKVPPPHLGWNNREQHSQEKQEYTNCVIQTSSTPAIEIAHCGDPLVDREQHSQEKQEYTNCVIQTSSTPAIEIASQRVKKDAKKVLLDF
jgi:hypothetical protein